MADMEFVKGLVVKEPHHKAPDFVKANISIKREELIDWLANRSDEWINIDVKEAKSGKWYAAVSQYKKNDAVSKAAKQAEDAVDYLPDLEPF